MMTKSCFTKETKIAFLSDALPYEVRENAESHLASCRACRHQMVILFEESNQDDKPFFTPETLREKAKQIPLQETSEKKSVFNAFFAFFRQPLAITVGGAALLFISLAMFFVLREQITSSQNSEREKFRQGNSSTNKIELLSPSANAQISTEQIEFRWSVFPNAKGYTIYVLDEKGDIITEQTTDKESFSLAVSTFRLTKGKHYFWFVKAKLADGIIKDSDTMKFTILK